MTDRYTRSRWLFGDDFSKLQAAKVLVCGCGGVGGGAIEALARSGVGAIRAIDSDSFDITNQNRQFRSENINEPKAAVFERELPNVRGIVGRIDESSINSLGLSDFDVIIDAIDDIKAKILLAKNASDKLLCSLGSAKRIDPSKLRYASIWQTKGDAFGAKFRYELRKSSFSGDFTCVYSIEEPRCKNLGSCMAVTASAGLMLASLAIRRILGEF